jgi:hypothetical protein
MTASLPVKVLFNFAKKPRRQFELKMSNTNRKPGNSLYIFAISFIAICGSFIILISLVASQSYCSNNKKECTDLKILSVPNNILPNLVGSFAGAVFTFCAYYFLEETKRRSLPKPRIELSFEPDKDLSRDEQFRELVVKCEPHSIYLKDENKNLEVGNACYLRVKVTNYGNIVGRNCRAYLKRIEEKVEGSNWRTLKGYEDSMPLLWAYESKEDYFVVSSGKDLASLASDYVDVLVLYESFIALKYLDNRHKELTKWFLKLKTKKQVPKHAKLLDISLSARSEFKLTVEVYADECLPSQVEIVLYHDKDQKTIQVYNIEHESEKEKEKYRAEMTLYSSMTAAPIGCDISEIYESL